MSSHSDHAAKQGLAVPCTAVHLTFGGKCLNCGYQPDTETAADQADDTSALRPGNVIDLDGQSYDVYPASRGILFWLRDSAPLGGEK